MHLIPSQFQHSEKMKAEAFRQQGLKKILFVRAFFFFSFLKQIMSQCVHNGYNLHSLITCFNSRLFCTGQSVHGDACNNNKKMDV